MRRKTEEIHCLHLNTLIHIHSYIETYQARIRLSLFGKKLSPVNVVPPARASELMDASVLASRSDYHM